MFKSETDMARVALYRHASRVIIQ